MKKLIFVAVAATCIGTSSYAMEDHNGIRFDMRQKDVEAKGFVCKTRSKEDQPHILAMCGHMGLTGVAFGFPTKDYGIIIGPTGEVDTISASFSGHVNTADYLSLSSKIQFFFPKKHDAGTSYMKSSRIDEWRAENNAAAVLMLFEGVPPYINTSLSILFRSPRATSNSDKNSN